MFVILLQTSMIGMFIADRLQAQPPDNKAIQSDGRISPPARTPDLEPPKEETEALNKQRMAEQLDAQARDRLGHARQKLNHLQSQRDALQVDNPARKQLASDIEYWLRVEQYEQRRIKQAQLVQRAAQEKKAIAELKNRLDEVVTTRSLLHKELPHLSPTQRQAEAQEYREQQQEALLRSQELLEQSAAQGQEAEPLKDILPGLNAVEEVLKERVLSAETPAIRQQLENHYRQMMPQLDSERQQTDLLIMTTENIAYAIARQADLEQQLAGALVDCAEVLVPPVASFWEKHRPIINSVKILGIALGVSYGLKFLVWLIEHALSIAQRVLGLTRVSVKRSGTQLGFFGSIIKLFVWVFAVIAILYEFGIDPKQSSGAIGLIGLVLAGMFQQIVVNFVKGLDIVIGKHYFVGDFVEVDGKFGHVVDFDVKHTRIRTLSGQEFNLPNSRCIPSRRFPDGFVTNYVDILFKNFEEAKKARPTIEAVGRDLNQRIEAIREEPCLQRYFREIQERVIGRFRVRVLPGCPWVISDYFVPEVKAALRNDGVELTKEPQHIFINRVATFRKLFSRQLSEEEIIRELQDTSAPPVIGGRPHDPASDEENPAQHNEQAS